MGKTSRRKYEPRPTKAAIVSSHGAKTLHVNAQNLITIYRYFREAEHATDFASGKVWISTLNSCRTYEDAERGDKEEGTLEYRTGHIKGDYGDKSFETMARRGGVELKLGATNCTLNATRKMRIDDAFVLCMAEERTPQLAKTFGEYCVEIIEPEKFFMLISSRLMDAQKVKECVFGRVNYQARDFSGLEEPPGDIGFVKPVDRYCDQKEVRFLWTVERGMEIKSFSLEVPEIARLCRLIDN